MGLTKQYLRYVPSDVFGVVGTQKSVIKMACRENVDNRKINCAVGAGENVLLWGCKTSEQILRLKGDKHEVTTLTPTRDNRYMAVGYIDGSINLYNLTSGGLMITLRGHNSSVTTLEYDSLGLQIASGSKDTNIVVWDVVNESGLYRLKGHKSEVTCVKFIESRHILISSSKDMLLKFWDLQSQHCFKTLVGHRTEIYSFCLLEVDSYLITGSADSELRVYSLEFLSQDDDDELTQKPEHTPFQKKSKSDETTETEDRIVRCNLIGSLMRHGRGRTVSLVSDRQRRFIACHGQDKVVEVYKVCSEGDITRYITKKKNKLKRKLGKSKPIPEVTVTLANRFPVLVKIETSAKLSSIDICYRQSQLQLCCLLSNNSIASYTIDPLQKTSALMSSVTRDGHRTDIRTVAFTSDNTAILSVSGDCMKIWNRASLNPIRSVTCDYALCSFFAPGDRHVVIGFKNGKVQLYDLASGSLLESINGHTGSVWALSLTANKKGFVSGSADHDVKFWNFEFKTPESGDSGTSTTKQLTFVHTKTLQMDEDVLCLKCSQNSKFLAVGLLDNTAKIFFMDTLKFFLSLYGHKFPVLCLDISTDSTLIVTGSADKNIKIWGLDFGDCHKSIFAHDDSITCIQFIPNTHMFFSGGKDGKLKQWDADNFQNIITLPGHHAEIWSLAISPSTNFVVTSSHDKSLRLWEKTDEPLILDEEREMEREKEHEEALTEPDTQKSGETTTEVDLPGKRTLDSVKGAESIMEALDVYDAEVERIAEHTAAASSATSTKVPPLQTNPLFVAYSVTSPDSYVLEVLKKVRSSDLEQALLVLPFSYTTRLLHLLQLFLAQKREVQLISRCTLFILRVNHGCISTSSTLTPLIHKLRDHLTSSLAQIKDMIGFNKAGLAYLQRQIDEQNEMMIFSDATEKAKREKRKKSKVILALKT